ncbi:uncharacterized protein B0T23DRAFT_324203 [Neurospora hispaniola]|uniref:Uncharacterized protein n=1 Tax=Neurospora hispaniola TaxID=588809 RepID=A0AAJ0I0Z1_9PEZI|nr:hypothetical protein B0T23DRAFT_324203 [Neurospora hispaniola]
MQWALTVISALLIEFLAMNAAVANHINYIRDEVSIIGLMIRWGFRNLNPDRDNTIKVFEGQTEVGEVASVDMREDKLFAVAGPGAGIFKGWELHCGVWSRTLELLELPPSVTGEEIKSQIL